jgi:hypothetical protein
MLRVATIPRISTQSNKRAYIAQSYRPDPNEAVMNRAKFVNDHMLVAMHGANSSYPRLNLLTSCKWWPNDYDRDSLSRFAWQNNKIDLEKLTSIHERYEQLKFNCQVNTRLIPSFNEITTLNIYDREEFTHIHATSTDFIAALSHAFNLWKKTLKYNNRNLYNRKTTILVEHPSITVCRNGDTDSHLLDEFDATNKQATFDELSDAIATYKHTLVHQFISPVSTITAIKCHPGAHLNDGPLTRYGYNINRKRVLQTIHNRSYCTKPDNRAYTNHTTTCDHAKTCKCDAILEILNRPSLADHFAGGIILAVIVIALLGLYDKYIQHRH